jgi:5-formyltetrahydrofolate cyclo-ligase
MAPLSSSDLTEDKRALRREMGARRAALPESERQARSEAASTRLLALPELKAVAGLNVAGYVAVKGEIDPAPALKTLTAHGATVALPRIGSESPLLRFARADAGRLVFGRFLLPEPPASAPEVPLDALDVVIVPGLAFDSQGHRLGFGGGYYDGAFGNGVSGDRTRGAILIGFGYDFQVVARCPSSVLDVPVDLVVTDTRVLRPGREPQ